MSEDPCEATAAYDAPFVLPNQIESPSSSRTRSAPDAPSAAAGAQTRVDLADVKVAFQGHIKKPVQHAELAAPSLAASSVSPRLLPHAHTRVPRPEELWLPCWVDGKLILVTGQRGVAGSRPPAFLLKEIARHSPPSQPGGIARQPNCASLQADEFPGAANAADKEICSRILPVRVQAINAGLLGCFFFDPCAWQCCNTAKAGGWNAYDQLACSQCRCRAATTMPALNAGAD